MSKTIILICVFLILGVIAYFILPRGEERITSYKGLDVDLTIDSAIATKIEIQKPGKSIIIENLDGKWTITSPGRYSANGSTVAQMLGGLKKFKVGSLISSNPQKQNMFQVDSTGTMLTVADRTGKTISMVIGKMGPSYSDLYFRLPNSNDVYLGEGITTWILNQELKDWRDKTIFSTTSDSIRQLSFAYKAKNFVLQRDSASWKYGTLVLDNAVISGALNTLSSLQAEDFIDSVINPSHQPISVNIQTSNSVTIDFFPQQPDSAKFTVRTSGSPQVYQVNKWTVQQILKPIESYIK
ncbi:MAG TPA: DUF4340 domain-containing protein [Bacteroidota bacterium]|nr:DUF4340 domain-containing protein [Bacteroidota bacterium]